MRRSLVVVVALSACSSPDTCDQRVVGDVVSMTMQHASAPSMGRNLPDNDHGTATQLAIHGSVVGCGNVDETCDLEWGPHQDENDAGFYRSGTLCGRHFP
ncbi:MAG TPA: hypothetical protein VLT45_05860 [Kofleriaceae bacterium]|nr:hypothetical protein [Kofleriaceae bacterium]